MRSDLSYQPANYGLQPMTSKYGTNVVSPRAYANPPSYLQGSPKRNESKDESFC